MFYILDEVLQAPDKFVEVLEHIVDLLMKVAEVTEVVPEIPWEVLEFLGEIPGVLE